MKIYDRVVIDMITMEIIEEESFEYSGPIDLVKGSQDNEIKETSQEQELARISNEQWSEYQTRFKPFEDKWIADTKTNANDQAKMAGQVNAGVGTEFDARSAAAADKTFAAGVDPSSGRFKGIQAGIGNQRGAVAGKAISSAGQAVDDQTYLGLQSAIAMGRGEAAGAVRDMTTLASDATRTALGSAYADQEAKNSMGSSIASAAGMGLAGWNNSKTPIKKKGE